MRRDFLTARRRLMMTARADQTELLRRVSLSIHPADGMYVSGSADHYLGVGLSAMDCIARALPHGFHCRSILDFPCGYGRVLRFLRVRFPEATVTAAELEPGAVEFCRREFGANPLLSARNLATVATGEKYDLIWCGSLFTHIDERSSLELMQFFKHHLASGGVCVFTTLGRYGVERLERKVNDYQLPPEGQAQIIRDFRTGGVGFAAYPDQYDYGITMVCREKIAEWAGDGWRETLHIERGWDNHQDVFAYTAP